MKLLTKDSDYAVRALQYIAQNKNGSVSSSELSGNLRISWSFLRKILFILQKNGIVKSIRGRLGGFNLIAKPDGIYLLDVIKMFQGQLSLTSCIINGKACQHIDYCVLRKKLLLLERKIIDELKDVTLKSLIDEENGILKTLRGNIKNGEHRRAGDSDS